MFMSLKLLKLHWRIFFWTITGKIKRLRSKLELNSNKNIPEEILIVFPIDEPTFRVTLYTFRNIGKDDIRKRKFIFLVREQFDGLFHLQMGETLFIHNTKQGNMLTNEKYLLQSLKQNKFDMIVDLNPIFHLGIARLISMLFSEIKVGFTSPFSDQFYNIQLDISKSGIMEKGFKQINLMLAQ